MKNYPIGLHEILTSLWHNRNLIFLSTEREVVGRYRGSFLGMFWSLFNPLLMLVVYTFVFSDIFKVRWSNNDNSSKLEFSLLLFAGLIVFNAFAECINRAPGLILSNINFVKKIIFPLEILPFIVLFSSFYHSLVSLIVWLFAYSIFIDLPHLTVIYLPMIFLPLSLFILGLSWGLASLGVYLRDVSQIIAVITTLLMFLTPIFYPVTALPDEYRYLIFLNPLTPLVEAVRDILFWGRPPSFIDLGFSFIQNVIIAWLGFIWFQKTRKGFSDVL